MRLAILILLVASRSAFAQTPGAPDSPPENPTTPSPPTLPTPPDDKPGDAPAPSDHVPPIPVVPQPPPQEPPGPPPKPREPPTQQDDTTSVRFARRYHFDLHWTILMLPERALELAMLPIGLLVGAMDQYRLDKRISELLSVENIKVKLSPRFKFSLGDGAGIGLWVKRELLDWRASMRAGGIIRLDGDWQTELEYNHALLFPGGRDLRARTYVERDKNQRYYGIGGDSRAADERVIQVIEQGALAEIDLQDIEHYTTSGIAQLGIRRQQLSTGVSRTTTPLMVGDTVAPPPGFDDIATYLDARLVGRYDTRDTAGRPSRGMTLEGSVLGRSDITGRNLSATTVSASARIYLPVLPDHRVLVLTVAGAAALPLIPGDDKPLDSLATVDRTNVRGYDRERFRDLYALVASAEYRFPIYEYLASRIGLDAFTFVDAGTIWGNDPFSLDPLRYSIGGGLRGASEPSLFFKTTLGWSPEGFQFNIGVETAL